MLFVIRRAKMPLQGVLPLPPIKSRRTPENALQAHLHKIWEYKNPGTVRRRWTAGNGIPIYTHEGILLKVCHVVTKL